MTFLRRLSIFGLNFQHLPPSRSERMLLSSTLTITAPSYMNYASNRLTQSRFSSYNGSRYLVEAGSDLPYSRWKVFFRIF